MLRNDAAAFRVFWRKVLRKIFGPMRVEDDFLLRFNSELCELLNDIDVEQRINIHVVRMEEDAPARRVFEVGICRSRRRGRSYMRWEDQIKEVLSSIDVINWRRRARCRGICKHVLR